MEDNQIVSMLQEANEYVTQGERGAGSGCGAECNMWRRGTWVRAMHAMHPPPSRQSVWHLALQ